MDLNIIWFILIAVLYVGFFVLEGFDFGVGMLTPFLRRDPDPAKAEHKQRLLINSIGPHWDGNEVWLLTAGGATFAAFPHWYATLFSGFYLALFLLLLALIGRGVALEFRSKHDTPRWKTVWDWIIFGGSLAASLLLGVAFGNLVQGLAIDADMQYVGGFWALLNPYALLAGLTTVVGFALYGATFLALKTSGELRTAANAMAARLWLPALVLQLALLAASYFVTDMISRLGINPGIVPTAGLAALLAAGFFIRRQREGWAFLSIGLAIAFSLITAFMIMFPRVMISSLDPQYSLTIYNASSTPYTLQVMTIIALTFVPIVIAYQAWSYWVFRKRLTLDSHLEY